jgi:transcriptional regulator with XRE-family HTH domain
MTKAQQDIVVLVDSDDPGGQIRRLRERAGLTRLAFAYHMGVDTTTVYRWERNETTPNIRQARQIAELVNRNWPKASKVSSLPPTYSFWPGPATQRGLPLLTAA